MRFRIIPRSYPNHIRFMLQTYQVRTLVHLQESGLVFCESASMFFLRNHSPQATPPAASEKNPTAAPCSGSCSLQWHQHANSKAHTPLCLPRGEAPCSSSVQQHPSLAPLQHELGTLRTLQLCSSTSKPARQHLRAAPSTGIRSPACPLQSMV